MKLEDFYEDIKPDINRLFDTGKVNNKVVGMFKDEAGGKIIEEFVGLREKLYSYKMHNNKTEQKRCKCIKKHIVTNTHDDYKECLLKGRDIMRKMSVLRSYKHEMYAEEVNKVALSPNDDKKIVREDGIRTYAYGHYKTTDILKTI